MQRILVIGVSGSGKSTLAAQIAKQLNLPYMATDPLYWGSDWRAMPEACVMEKIKTIAAHETWVLDGNFEAQRELVWKRADTIVWLNYAFALVAWRVITRNLRWCITQEATWSGNRMMLSRAFSGIRHSLHSFERKRRWYPQYLREVSGCRVLIFDSPQATAKWLASLSH